MSANLASILTELSAIRAGIERLVELTERRESGVSPSVVIEALHVARARTEAARERVRNGGAAI